MPQLQLPIFPAGVTEINSRIAVQKEAGRVFYLHGHLPVFQHEEQDVRSFRMFTSQMIAGGTVKPKEIVKTFGVPMITVKRYVKLYRDHGSKGFYEANPRHSSASVLKGPVLEQAQQLLDEGRSVPEVAAELNVLTNTLHKAIRAGRLRGPQKKAGAATEVTNKSERSQTDSQAPMGNGATRSLERVAAAMGELESAPIEFQATCDVAQGGVLLALPALLATGLLRYTPEFYQLPKGFYGIESIFLLLGLMALARIRSLEQLRYQAPGEWGKLLGLDRIPEVRTLRAKLKLLCQDMGLAMRWNAALAQEWIARQNATELYFYCDGHVRVYHGDQTALPRHYVARERLCLRATTDYWINAMDGQPFLYVNKEVDPGLIATLKGDVIPWLEANVAKTPEQEQRLAEDPRAHWFTMVFDREGYSPELFEQMRKKRIAILSYHKFPGDDWRSEEFATYSVTLAGGETVTMQLAERGSQLSNKLWLREIRKLTDTGHQTSILTTNFQAPMTTLAVSLFARWSQENFFRYMREHFGLDRLIEYGTELIPDAISVVNPAWRKLDSLIRSKAGQLFRLAARFGALVLSEDPSESQVLGFQHRKGHLREETQALQLEIDNLKQLRKKTEHHIPVNSLPEEDQFTRLCTERKHFIDTLKMIAYRAESSMASLLREHMARGGDDARALLRQIFQTEADLTPDLAANTLTVSLHHLTQAAHDQAIEQLLADLNATQTVFPGTQLTLVFKLGSA
jgi:transposase-like protein